MEAPSTPDDISAPTRREGGQRQRRFRRWHVTFGNPALGTYGGSVVTVHPPKRRSKPPYTADCQGFVGGGGESGEEDSDCQSLGDDSDEEDESVQGCSSEDEDDDESRRSSSFSSCSSFSSSGSLGVVEGQENSGERDADDHDCATHRLSRRSNLTRRSSRTAVPRNVAAMVQVPPHQVPDGVLNLVRAHRPAIRHVRIVIGSTPSEERERRRERRERKRRDEERAIEQRERELEKKREGECFQRREGVSRESTIQNVSDGVGNATARLRSQTWASSMDSVDCARSRSGSNEREYVKHGPGDTGVSNCFATRPRQPTMSKHGRTRGTENCGQEHEGEADVSTLKLGGQTKGRNQRAVSLDNMQLMQHDHYSHKQGDDSHGDTSTHQGVFGDHKEIELVSNENYCSPHDRRLDDNLNDEEDLDKNYLVLFVLESEEAASSFVSDLHRRPYTTLDETDTCSVYRVIDEEGEDGVKLIGPLFASSSSHPTSVSPVSKTENKDASTGTNKHHPYHTVEDHQCPVCLEKILLPSSFSQLSPTPSSTDDYQQQASPTQAPHEASKSNDTNHSDASASASLLNPCPSLSILTTVCNHSFHIDCLLRWQDSPCPVCRYDHSGLNDALSRCHACFTTSRNYVCLICGMISCASGPGGGFDSSEGSEGERMEQGTAHQPPQQVPSARGHALHHYLDTLHAYALDTDTQHVWDFAGGGYVHRLLQNVEDGKIVEGLDPRARSMEEGRFNTDTRDDGTVGVFSSSPHAALEPLTRSTTPFSPSKEDEHRKLEDFASQYYTLLKSQLEQQRIYYEGKLGAERRDQNKEHRSQLGPASVRVASALKQERHQLERQCTALRRKCEKVSSEAVFLGHMNESLESDKNAFRLQIREERILLAEARDVKKQCLLPLEEKVQLLILQLECDDTK